MTESLESREHAASFLQDIYEQLEDQSPLEWDVDFDGIALKVEAPDDQTLLVYYHTVMNQLWYSSTISGAHHFHLMHNHWISTRDDQDFLSIFLADLHHLHPSIELRHHA